MGLTGRVFLFVRSIQPHELPGERDRKIQVQRRMDCVRKFDSCILSAAVRGASRPTNDMQDRQVEAKQDNIAHTRKQCPCDPG